MSPKIIRVGLLTPPRTLDPHQANDAPSILAAVQVYEYPCLAPPDQEAATLVLFQALEQTGPTTWAATLRPDLTLSDGTPLDSATAAAAFSRSAYLRQQATVEAQGQRVVFSLRAPNPRFDLVLSVHLSAVALERPDGLLGTGPFLPAPGTRLDELRLVRNPHYRHPVDADEVIFRVYPPDRDGQPTALLQAIARGEVDYTATLPRAQVAGLPRMRMQALRLNSTALLFFNAERPALADPRARRALALAIDRFALAELSFANPLAHVASGPLPPILGALRGDLVHDLERARALLAQVSPRPTAPLRMVTIWQPRPYLPNPRAAAEAIARQLGRLGLQLEITCPTRGQDFFDRTESGDYDLSLCGWVTDTPDPADFLEDLLRSDRVPQPGGTGANLARLRSPELDRALAGFRQRRTPSDSEALQRLLAEQMPLVPLMYGADTLLISWRLRELEVTPWGFPLLGTARLGT